MSAPQTDHAARPLTEEDVAALRRAVFEGGTVGWAGIERLFETLAVHGDAGPPSWPSLFVDALATYVVDEVHPEGYVSQENADWLVASFSSDHRVLRRTEFEALLAVMTRARLVPDSLAAFALALLRDAIVTGEGALAGAGGPRGVTREDVEALRRILYAASSEGFGWVTRAEAEVLFDIADATGGRGNDPAFNDLFARAIGNHLLAAQRHTAPEVHEALRRERWLDERQSLAGGVTHMFSRALTCVISGDGFVDAAGSWLAKGTADTILAGGGAGTGAFLDAEEALWLRQRLSACDAANPAIVALHRFLREEAVDDPAEGQPELGKVA